MTAELNGLVSDLQKNLSTLRKVSTEVEKQKREILDMTVSTRDYCSRIGITPMTLCRWREKGKVPYAMIGTEYRYYLPEEGGQNV